MKKIICLLFIVFSITTAQARTVIVFGQSNAAGLMRHAANFTDYAIDCIKPATAIHEFKFSLDSTSIFGKCFLGFNRKKIDAIVFWQGESDNYDDILAANWIYSASRIITDLREFIGNPRVPVVMVEMRPNGCQTCNHVNWNIIRRAQVNFMLAYKIDSGNYPFDEITNAGMHLTEQGYIDMSTDINAMLTNILGE